MVIDIQPKHVPLGELMQNRLFRIPDYQRTYSWGRKQRDDLFEDITQANEKGPDRSHFMATIVGLRREPVTIGTTDHTLVEIVDGQQRITTLILLLQAIANAAGSSDSDNDQAIKNEIASILVKDDKATLLLLQTNHDTSDYFKRYIREGIHPGSDVALTVADQELLRAMEDCERFVDNWLGKGQSLMELVRLLKNRLTFVFHEVGDEKLVYTVFEVLNSRGLEVSWFDRLKSALMAKVFESEAGNRQEIIDEVHRGWAEIYRTVGLRQRLSIDSMRTAATLKAWPRPNRPLGASDSVHQLLQFPADGAPSAVVDTTNWLKDVTTALGGVDSDPRRGVTNMAQARMVAVAIHLRSDFSDAEKEVVLRQWEKVTFRVYGLFGEDARRRVGDYVRLAWNIINNTPTTEEILTQLNNIGAEFPINKAVTQLMETDCYTDWGGQLLYFFRRYEEYLAKEEGQNFDNEQWNRIWMQSPSNSIEHIRPQSLWDDDEDPRKHSLGNLMILTPGLNSKLQDKPVNEKADEYTQTGLFVARQVAASVAKLKIKSHWTFRAMKARERVLIQWARQEWAD